MKRILPIVLIALVSCAKKTTYKDSISEFYKVTKTQDYKQIKLTDIDTIEVIKDIDSSVIRMQGFVVNVYSYSVNGRVVNKLDTFDVTIFKDTEIAIPRGY